MSLATLLLLILPLLTALLLPTLARSLPGAARAAGPVVLVILAILALQLWNALPAYGPFSLHFAGFLPPLGIVFYVDRMALLFVLGVVASALLLWPDGHRDPVREPVLTLLLVAGANGLALSGDIFNIYVFYEIIAVASFGLAASRASGGAMAASLRYLLLGAAGSTLILVGIALIYAATGTLNLAHLAVLAPQALHGPLGLSAFALLVLGFGVKAELFPVNTWVPEVYAHSGARVAGLLAGLVSKLGLLAILRVLTLCYAGTHAADLLLVLGMLTIAAGELAAYRSHELKRALAFSSIGQLGVVAVAFAIDSQAGLFAGLALALHHMLIKPALFLFAEGWEDLDGAARRHPVAGALFVLLALSLIGVPPLPGFWAKYLLLTAALGDGGSALHALAAAVVVTATVVETAYLFRFIERLYRRPVTGQASDLAGHGARVLALGGLFLIATVSIAPLGAALSDAARQGLDVNDYIANTLPHGSYGLGGGAQP